MSLFEELSDDIEFPSERMQKVIKSICDHSVSGLGQINHIHAAYLMFHCVRRGYAISMNYTNTKRAQEILDRVNDFCVLHDIELEEVFLADKTGIIVNFTESYRNASYTVRNIIFWVGFDSICGNPKVINPMIHDFEIRF
jgi:hypothetical protein